MSTTAETPMRLLVVDDDPAVRRLLGVVLDDLGEVHEATDVVEAWHHVTAHEPDVVVLDVMLPDASGLSLLSRLRADPDHADRPVVLVTALDDPIEQRTGTAAGADAYVTKPFSPEVLTRTVERVARNGRFVARPATTGPTDDLPPTGDAMAQR